MSFAARIERPPEKSKVKTRSGTQISIPLGLPTNLDEGQFCTLVCIADASGNVSNYVETCVNVLRLGSGALQVSLAWNTDGTDVDLHVTEPGGEEISYRNRRANGGELDRDDTDGFGPENIFWDEAPDGVYQVDVNYYSGSEPTAFTISLSGAGGASQLYSGSLQMSGERVSVARITKEGDALRFEAAGGE